mmetsp:Transcript_28146/g.48833  ORF Transcript_28146/g.48833 Transcript_28146/m.48833 type:complete len:204 (-) Transcript_28146:173-784(-)
MFRNLYQLFVHGAHGKILLHSSIYECLVTVHAREVRFAGALAQEHLAHARVRHVNRHLEVLHDHGGRLHHVGGGDGLEHVAREVGVLEVLVEDALGLEPLAALVARELHWLLRPLGELVQVVLLELDEQDEEVEEQPAVGVAAQEHGHDPVGVRVLLVREEPIRVRQHLRLVLADQPGQKFNSIVAQLPALQKVGVCDPHIKA